MNNYTIAIAGLGAIGLPVAKALDEGIEGLQLCAVSVRDKKAAMEKLAGFKRQPRLVSLPELAELADVVVESIPAVSFAQVAEPAIEQG